MYDRRNPIRLEMEAKSENEALARSVAGAYILEADPTTEELTEIRTAVSEAVSNCVIHAYPRERQISMRETLSAESGEAPGVVTLEAWWEGERTIVFAIQDRGVGIADVQQAREPLFTTAPEAERSGMGFTLMESFMDRLEVESGPGRGTRVTMKKLLDRCDV